MVSTKQKPTIYKRLSNFGVFVWFGILASMWMIFACVQQVGTAFDGLIPEEMMIVGMVLFFVFICCSSVDSVYNKYSTLPESHVFSVSGRMSRFGYFCYLLVLLGVWCIVANIPIRSSDEMFIPILILLPFNVAMCTAAIRRAQDCGFYPWFPLIPIVSIVLLFMPSDKDNAYGPRPTKTAWTKKVEAEKINIVNGGQYINKNKSERIKYLYDLKEKTLAELTKLRKEIEKENDKLKDVPEDIAGYIKHKDTSAIESDILKIETKIKAVEELIESETAKPTNTQQPQKSVQYTNDEEW